MENSMTKAENVNTASASNGSGCGCASKATPLTPNTEAAKSGCCGEGHDHSAHDHDHQPSGGKATVRDPVCGITVDPATSQHRFEYRGETYHFCPAGCRTKFVADPKQYLDKSVPKPAVPEGTIYTCPMHPQIRQVGPGNCPICGMALEPEVATAETGPNPELTDMTRRFW